jgi:hypothetical protein
VVDGADGSAADRVPADHPGSGDDRVQHLLEHGDRQIPGGGRVSGMGLIVAQRFRTWNVRNEV